MVFLLSLLAELDATSHALFKVILTGYGFWNLDYFRYIIPPFCVSQVLKNMHVPALQYISTFYPLLLIFLTYICVELHAWAQLQTNCLVMETISQMLCYC